MKPRLIDAAIDQPLPQSVEHERAVLGCCLQLSVSYKRVAAIVQTSDFYRDGHRLIFDAIAACDAEGSECDILTVKDKLTAAGMLERAGGSAYISGLLDGIPDVANVERYARTVREKAQLRELIALGNETMRRALDGEERPMAIAADLAERAQLVRPSDAMEAVIPFDTIVDRVKALYGAGGVRRGAATGWPSVDEYYTVAPGAWTLVTGIPGHGKSGLLDNLTINLAQLHRWQVVMFSAENYPPESHVASMLEKFLGEPFNEGKTARMSATALDRAAAFVGEHFRFIDPAAERITLDRVLATATALSEKKRVNVLTIDPWNELQHERAKEITETEYISVSLTKIRRWARKHAAHVFLVAHPQKMQKDRDSGVYAVPTPYDVSGSAHWRNKADYCLTVYRDISPTGDDPNVQLHVQKVRRREIGRVGMVNLRYSNVTSQYSDPKVPRVNRWDVS